MNLLKKQQDDNPLDDKREADFKFEWQKNAPREKYLKGQTEGVTDQPFGIAVKNVKCLKVYNFSILENSNESYRDEKWQIIKANF